MGSAQTERACETAEVFWLLLWRNLIGEMLARNLVVTRHSHLDTSTIIAPNPIIALILFLLFTQKHLMCELWKASFSSFSSILQSLGSGNHNIMTEPSHHLICTWLIRAKSLLSIMNKVKIRHSTDGYVSKKKPIACVSWIMQERNRETCNNNAMPNTKACLYRYEFCA